MSLARAWRDPHCGHDDNADIDINAARKIARSVDYAHPKRTLRRVGKRKPSEEMVDVSSFLRSLAE
jgi:transposase